MWTQTQIPVQETGAEVISWYSALFPFLVSKIHFHTETLKTEVVLLSLKSSLSLMWFGSEASGWRSCSSITARGFISGRCWTFKEQIFHSSHFCSLQQRAALVSHNYSLDVDMNKVGWSDKHCIRRSVRLFKTWRRSSCCLETLLFDFQNGGMFLIQVKCQWLFVFIFSQTVPYRVAGSAVSGSC